MNSVQHKKSKGDIKLRLNSLHGLAFVYDVFTLIHKALDWDEMPACWVSGTFPSADPKTLEPFLAADKKKLAMPATNPPSRFSLLKLSQGLQRSINTL